MQLNETDKMALEFNKKIREKLGDRVGSFVIEKVNDDSDNRFFSITFKMYDYYVICFNYDRGFFSCCIDFDVHGCINLESSQKCWDTADFDIFFEELKNEIELRIPDKFLRAKGWL
ncbi:MAG: hypothetical protein IJ429_01290 [Lachnospiraceae bacterium]|nr:hypothetical protein [Lachnospiraceae bacterium]